MSLVAVYYYKYCGMRVHCCPGLRLYFLLSFGGGSVGGTPHSGTPFGLAILFGSQSSSAAALNFLEVCQSHALVTNEGDTHIVLLPDIEFLSVLVKPKSLFFAHLYECDNKNRKSFRAHSYVRSELSGHASHIGFV